MAVNFLSRVWVNKRCRPAFVSCPGLCRLCSSPISHEHGLCISCQEELSQVRDFCINCATPLNITSVCGACINQRQPPWQYAYAAFDYAYPVNLLIQQMKYRRRLDIASVLASLAAGPIERVVCQYGRPDIITPVPLHKTRLAIRGFNQANEIARTLGERLGIGVNPDLCRRIKKTPAQARLDARQRTRNIRGAFNCNERLCAGKSIALFDDVITTASTVREVAQELKKAGAKNVMVWAVARQQSGF